MTAAPKPDSLIADMKAWVESFACIEPIMARTVQKAAARIAELERENEALRGDAARWRWCRANWHQAVKIVPLDDSWKRIEALDARVDAWIAKEPPA
jgi:hypothetical protein